MGALFFFFFFFHSNHNKSPCRTQKLFQAGQLLVMLLSWVTSKGPSKTPGLLLAFGFRRAQQGLIYSKCFAYSPIETLETGPSTCLCSFEDSGKNTKNNRLRKRSCHRSEALGLDQNGIHWALVLLEDFFSTNC